MIWNRELMMKMVVGFLFVVLVKIRTQHRQNKFFFTATNANPTKSSFTVAATEKTKAITMTKMITIKILHTK